MFEDYYTFSIEPFYNNVASDQNADLESDIAEGYDPRYSAQKYIDIPIPDQFILEESIKPP